MSCNGVGVVRNLSPSSGDVENLIRQCIANTFCKMWEKQCKGYNVSEERATLTFLSIAFNTDIWNTVGDDYSRLYCGMPECLNNC